MKLTTCLPLLLGALCGVGTDAIAQSNDSDSKHASDADAFLQKELILKHIPGMSVCVARHNRVLLAKGYGRANLELSVPTSEHTAYELASLTKPFTALAIMLLVEQGRLSLTDPIKKFLPAAPSTWDQITVSQLLSHTSGLGDYFSVAELKSGSVFEWTREYSPETLLPLLFKVPIVAAPGEKWSYSNTGYYVLGLILEKVSGQPYEQFLQQKIFAPLGMTETRRMSREDIIPDRASGYIWLGGTLKNAIHTSKSWAYSEGGLVSSVSDLAKAAQGLFGDKILTKAMIQSMLQPYRLNDGRLIPHGLGWNIEGESKEREVSHSGNKPGFSSSIRHFEDESLTVVVLLNVDTEDPRQGDAGAISYRVASAFLQQSH